MISNWDDEYTDAAAFTPNSKSIVIVGDGKISLRDTLLSRRVNQKDIDLKAPPFTQSGVLPGKIKSVEISKDGKRMLMAQKDDRVFLLETKNGDSLFKKDKDTTGNLRLKEISNNKNKSRASFYNDSTVITIQEGGTVNLWRIYPDFDDPANAFAAVLPAKSFKEKLQEGAINFAGVLASDNTAADYYYRNEKIDYAKKIYRKLLDQGPDEMRGTYLSKILLLNLEMNTVDRINTKLDPKRWPLDTIKAYRLIKLNRLKENINLTTQQSQLCNNKDLYNEDLSTLYGSLAFNQLFSGDFEGAVLSATTGLKLFPQNDWINTNLALGNLLAGRYAQAEAIYRKYKSEMFYDKSRSFKSAFLADFKDLEDAGIIAGQRQAAFDVARIKRLLEY
jgi:WD40 repeat protein